MVKSYIPEVKGTGFKSYGYGVWNYPYKSDAPCKFDTQETYIAINFEPLNIQNIYSIFILC